MRGGKRRIRGNISPRHLEMHVKYNKRLYKWQGNLWAKKKKETEISKLEIKMVNWFWSIDNLRVINSYLEARLLIATDGTGECLAPHEEELCNVFYPK